MMKKIGLLLILLLTLVGCQKEVTTFNETILDDKVEIDGITYDIKSIRENTYKYDKNGNLIRRDSVYDDQVQHTEFLYDNDLLIEEKRSSLNGMNSTVYYTYVEDRKTREEIKYESGIILTTLFTYEGQNMKIEFWDDEGKINHYNKGVLDEQDNLLRWTGYDHEENITVHSENFYENNQLIRSISEGVDGKIVTHYYEYNNLGDKIFWYGVRQGKEPYLIVNFYEYEYNKDDLPIAMKQYSIYSPISEEHIRDYWQLK
jgi:uncharacterized protein YcfL